MKFKIENNIKKIMKTNSLVFFIIILIFLCSNGLRAQNELRIFVASIDTAQIAHAEVWMNDENLQYSNIRQAYIKTGFIYNKKDTFKFTISHKDYLSRKIIITDSEINEAKHSYNKWFYLFTKNQHCYINGRDSIPFNYRPRMLCVMFNNIIKEEPEINDFLKKMKFNRIGYQDGYVLLKKKNGRKFKDFNCKELKILRESNLVLGAGPMIGNGYFSENVYLEPNNRDKVKEIMKGLGFEFIRFEPYSSTMLFKFNDNSIGYGLIDITNKLLQYSEIKSIRLEVHAPVKYY